MYVCKVRKDWSPEQMNRSDENCVRNIGFVTERQIMGERE
jgi:hypothetical protein